jgi:hypothetical protein
MADDDVFTLRDGRIVRTDDHRGRREALTAAWPERIDGTAQCVGHELAAAVIASVVGLIGTNQEGR